MLVLSRKQNERIIVSFEGAELVLTLVEIRGDKVRLGFEAPPSVGILRSELLPRDERKSDASE